MIGGQRRILRRAGDPIEECALSPDLLPAFDPCGIHPEQVYEAISDQYRDLEGVELHTRDGQPMGPRITTTPISIALGSEAALQHLVDYSFRTLSLHYHWGKMQIPEFPKHSCGKSVKNVVSSMLLRGIPATTGAYNYFYDHDYVLIPFVLGRRKGSLLLDPTSEQCWNIGSPKLLVDVKWGLHWSYKTDYKRSLRFRKNLRPEQYLHLGTIIHRERHSKHPPVREEWKNPRDFLRMAYANPVSVDLPQL